MTDNNIVDISSLREIAKENKESAANSSPKMLASEARLENDEAMEGRVTRLEVEFEHVRKDLDEIKADNKEIIGRLAQLPTKGNLFGYIVTAATLALAVVGIFVGVLTYLGSLSS